MTQFNSPYFPQMLDLGEYIDRNPTIVDSLIKKKSDIYKKWLPVIERGFDDIKISESTMSDICLYCELCNVYYDALHQIGYKLAGNELSGVLSEIRNKILNKDQERVAVVRKVYNYQTGFMEYELEDGKFVKIINESVSGPKVDISKDIFCEQFVKHIDISSYRDMKIDKLI